MKFRHLFFAVITAFVLSQGLAQAQSVSSQMVTTTGNGPSEKEAVFDALAQAVGQVRGLSISSTEYISIKDVLKNDMSSNITEYKNNINTRTHGLVSSFSINQSQKVPSGLYQVSVTSSIPVYKAGQQLNRLRMVVLPLKMSPRIAHSSAAINAGHRWITKLEDSLVQTRRFGMLDRSFGDQTRSELAQYINGEFNPAEAARIGQKAGADYIVTGQIIKFGGSEKALQNPLTGALIQQSSTDAEISLRVIDVATSQVKFAKTYGSPAQASVDIINAIYPLMVVSLSPNGVTIGQGGDMLKLGQTFQVFALGNDLKDPYTGESLGRQEIHVGKVQVIATQFKTSEAKIINGADKIAANFPGGLLLRPISGEVKPQKASVKNAVSEKDW